VSISNWGVVKNIVVEKVSYQQSVAIKIFEPAQRFPPLPVSRVHFVNTVSQTPKYLSLPEKFQMSENCDLCSLCINLEIYLIDDSQRQHDENDQKR
jgi:hypothetical protein